MFKFGAIGNYSGGGVASDRVQNQEAWLLAVNNKQANTGGGVALLQEKREWLGQ